jgi:hypothetical protein
MQFKISSISLLFLILFSFVVSAKTPLNPNLPIRSGTYKFQHKFAEHPSMPSIALTATIKGRYISLDNKMESQVFPKGNIASGKLMWHAKSKQWIIGNSKQERFAEEVGGCSNGPEVVDLKKRIYWTC